MPAVGGPRRLLPGEHARLVVVLFFVSYFETGHALSDFLL